MRLLVMPRVRIHVSRRTLLWGFTAAVVLALAFAARVVVFRRLDAARLQAIVAQLDTAGPWRTLDLERQRAAIPDDRNNSVIMTSLYSLFPRQLPFDDMLHEPYPPKRQWSPEYAAAVSRLIASPPGADALWEKLRDRPVGRHPYVHSPDGLGKYMPHVDQTIRLLILARWRGLAAAEAGRSAEMFAELRAYENVVRSLSDEPVPYSQILRFCRVADLVSILERILAQTEPAIADLDQLRTFFDTELAEPTWRRYLESERAAIHDFYESLHARTLKPSVARATWARGGWVRGPKTNPTRVDRALNDVRDWIGEDFQRPHAIMLEEVSALIATADRPFADQEVYADRPPTVVADDWPFVHRDGLKTVFGNFRTNAARILCARVGLQCELHRLRTGRYPEAPADWPGERSPYDGTPLKLLPTPTGLEVVCPGSPPNTPVRFRLFRPEHRRQPPLPPPAPPQHYRIEMVTP